VNTETGQLYSLYADSSQFLVEAQHRGDEPTRAEAEHRLGRKLESQEAAALEAVRRREQVVPISGRVAQQLKVGDRELKRRKRRAQTRARRRQRG
jgi:hypothetical protein